MLAFHEQPEEIVTYDLHVVHLQLIEPLRDEAAHYRLIVSVGRDLSESHRAHGLNSYPCVGLSFAS